MPAHTTTQRVPRRLRTALSALLVLGCMGMAQAAEITVSAAASLTDAFKEITQGYQQQFPDAQVRLNFAGSGTLLQQMAKGAPVDVFASADQATMNQAQEQRLIDAASRRDFARNTLVLIVPTDSTTPIRTLADLTADGVRKIAIGNPDSVPVGRYTMKVLGSNPHWPAMQPKVIHTQHVRQALNYVARGEVEAGFVYGTDAALMRNSVRIASEVPMPTPIVYPIAIAKNTSQQAEAQRFVHYVLSPAGQAVLGKFGFQTVSSTPASQATPAAPHPAASAAAGQ